MNTMYTLLQRLVTKDYPDEEKSLNYDYMGAAEYEFGATLWPRMVVSQDECVVITDAVLNWRRYDINNWKVHIRYPKYLETDLGKPALARIIDNLMKGNFQNKMPAVYTHLLKDKVRSVVGWLMLEPVPMLIYRVEYKYRAKAFMTDIYKQSGFTGKPTLADAKRLYEEGTKRKVPVQRT